MQRTNNILCTNIQYIFSIIINIIIIIITIIIIIIIIIKITIICSELVQHSEFVSRTWGRNSEQIPFLIVSIHYLHSSR